MTERYQVIQGLLDLFNNPSYLEIGVNEGVTFHNVIASKKVAVDPHFLFKDFERDDASTYFEETSDRFFEFEAFSPERYDVVYLDGLHTLEQTLRDLLNAIGRINEYGIIVIDDVLPNSYRASLKNLSEFEALWAAADLKGDVSWMGDVYRLVFFIRAFMRGFSYATIKDNHGQLVLWRAQRGAEESSDRLVEEIARLEYKDLLLSSHEYNFMDFTEIVRLLRARNRFVSSCPSRSASS